MKSNDLLDMIGSADDSLIAEAKNRRKRKKNTWVKWGAMAACLCLIIGGIFMIPQTHDGTKVISHYDANSGGQYPVPGNGQIVYEAAVRQARDKYSGKDVTYLLAFNIFENEESVSSEKEEEEYQRLITEGYELYSAEKWTYQGKGEKKYHTVVVGYFTEDQLANFKSNSNYGYFFYFVKNGDGSEIRVDEDNLITAFPRTTLQ